MKTDCTVFLVGLALCLAALAGQASGEATPGNEEGRVMVGPVHAKGYAVPPPEFKHELWGRTYYGEGYVYGPTLWRSSMAVVDIDADNDNDFAFRPHYSAEPQIMRNLGTSGAFYLGGLQVLDLPDPDATTYLDVVMDFADVTGDGLPDLVVVANRFDPHSTLIVWYVNNNGHFTYQGQVYESPQSTLPELSLSLADINGDGLLDLFFLEPFLEDSERPHRVFLMLNEGTSTAPDWGHAAAEIQALSRLMPPRIEYSAKKQAGPSIETHFPRRRRQVTKASYGVRVSDIEVIDWNVDGRLDFLFYDAERGVDEVRNVGTAQQAAWASEITATPPWDHTCLEAYGVPVSDHTPLDTVFGSFDVCPNPDAYLPEAKWLDDFHIAMDGWLVTLRYYEQDSGYRLIQENAIEYASGQGPAAFWDYDNDGDLDLFRSATGSQATNALLLFPNIGTAYSPAWGDYEVIHDVTLYPGAQSNCYREDLYTFADFDGDGVMGFFVQGQDGRIARYAAHEALAGGLPTFTLLDSDFGGVVAPWYTNVQPRGLAVANFGGSGDGRLEIIAAYDSDEGGMIVWYGYDYDLDDYSLWDLTGWILDEEGATLQPCVMESLAPADLDRDGRTDLVITTSEYPDAPQYRTCTHHFYRNVVQGSVYNLVYAGAIEAPQDVDPYYARMISFADIDADSDDDLFVGHQQYYPDSDFRWPFLRFFRNDGDNGLDYWRTRMVAGQEWPLQWTDPPPNYTQVLNASGGSIVNPGNYRAGPNAPVVDIIESIDLTTNVRVFIDVLPPVGAEVSKAIVVVGGDVRDSLYTTFGGLAAYAYWVLRTEGLSRDCIRFLSSATGLDVDDDGYDDVYGAPTLALLESSITQWATGTDRLLVYFIDHGRRGSFRVNATEYLDASVYAGWLNALQAGGTGPQVTTIIDTCEAGSFVGELALTKEARKAGAQRITMTSSGVGAVEGLALFDTTQYLSFSLSFWQEIFNGSTYGQAFDNAKVSISAINPLQVPQIDDDGDGVPNEANDGLLADSARPGADFALPSSGVFIGDVAPTQVVSTSSATLWLSDVVADFPVEEAGALVVPPNYQLSSQACDDEQPVTGLDWVDFSYNEARGRWQGTYSKLNEGGLYRVQYFVSAGGRYHPSPRIGYVDRINTPDAWEQDNSAGSAAWLPINSVQGHNFHTASDADWARFTAPVGNPATIAVIAPGYRCQPVVALYKQSQLDANPAAAPVYEVEAGAPGKDVTFERTFSASEQYLIRVSNRNGSVYGEGTSYMLMVAVGTGGPENLVPTTLVVTVLEQGTNTPIEKALVTFDHSVTCATTADGIAQFICPAYGNYHLLAEIEGFKATSGSVNVNNLFETAAILLSEETNDPGCFAAGTVGNPFSGGKPKDLAGNLLVMLLSLGFLVLKGRRLQQP